MPLYQCHKRVTAFKIGAIVRNETGAQLRLREIGSDAIQVSHDYLGRHQPEVDGYVMLNEDEPESYWRTHEFEKSFTRIADLDPTGRPTHQCHRRCLAFKVGEVQKGDDSWLLIPAEEGLDPVTVGKGYFGRRFDDWEVGAYHALFNFDNVYEGMGPMPALIPAERFERDYTRIA